MVGYGAKFARKKEEAIAALLSALEESARLHQASGAAVSAVLKIMVDPGAPASTRLRAVDIVLEHTAKAIEIEDIEARVAALEATMASGSQRE